MTLRNVGSDFCSRPATEQDAEHLMLLVQEINRLLQEKDECLKQTRTGIRQQHKATVPELSGSIVIAAVSRVCPVCSTGMSSSPDRRELSNICVIVLTLSAYFD